MSLLSGRGRSHISWSSRASAGLWSIRAVWSAASGAGLRWLLPLILALITLALLFGFIGGVGPLAPFIYPLL